MSTTKEFTETWTRKCKEISSLLQMNSDHINGCWPSMTSRWLDVVLFCVFIEWDGVEVHKLEKNIGQYPAILTSCLVKNPYMYLLHGYLHEIPWWIESCKGCHRSGNGQGQNSSRSGNYEGMFFWVKEYREDEKSQRKLKKPEK